MRLHGIILASRTGNVAMIFALLTPLLVLVAGGAIDITDASLRRAQLQQAADAAATAAVARYSPGYEAANLLTAGGSVPDASTYANTLGVFNANWPAPKDVSMPAMAGVACDGSTIVCRRGTNVYASVIVKATFMPYFLGIASLVPGFQGIKTIPLTVNAQAVASTPTYINYYIIVDASQTMGIASTPADMTALYNRVVSTRNGTGGEVGCVFGCHVPANNAYSFLTNSFSPTNVQLVSNEALAHNPLFGPYITLRIDSAKAAIQSIIPIAQRQSGGYNNIKIGLYTISHDPNTGAYYNVISPPSTDYSALTNMASGIDLGGNNQYGYGDTDFNDELPDMYNLVLAGSGIPTNAPANGDGATPQAPQNFVFIITDGLSDSSGASINNHPTAAFDPSLCTSLKKVATVGVIYTTYNTIYNQNNSSAGFEGNYSALVAPYVNQIPSNLMSCTSDPSQYYFQATDGPDIVSRMQQLFAATQKVAHLAH